MKLSKLTKMAALALDAHESGDETAAPELHAFCMAHLDEIAEALCVTGEAIEAIRNYDVAAFPAALLKTCRVDRIRKASRDAVADRKEASASEAAAAFVATATLDGLSYKFDGAALAALAKISRPSDTIFLGVTGYPFGLPVPSRVLRELNRARPLKGCQVHMTSPVYGDWRFIVQWSDKGYYQWRATSVQPNDSIAVLVPSMTDMVSRELGCEAA